MSVVPRRQFGYGTGIYCSSYCRPSASGQPTVHMWVKLTVMSGAKDTTTGGSGGSGPPKIWTVHPNFFDEECDYRYVTDCSALNWVYHPHFVLYSNLEQGIGLPTLRTWLRRCLQLAAAAHVEDACLQRWWLEAAALTDVHQFAAEHHWWRCRPVVSCMHVQRQKVMTSNTGCEPFQICRHNRLLCHTSCFFQKHTHSWK